MLREANEVACSLESQEQIKVSSQFCALLLHSRFWHRHSIPVDAFLNNTLLLKDSLYMINLPKFLGLIWNFACK